MKIVENWQVIWRKAWSVKFNIAAALLGGLEVAVSLIKPASVPNGLFAAFAVVVSGLALGARFLAQKEISGANDE